MVEIDESIECLENSERVLFDFNITIAGHFFDSLDLTADGLIQEIYGLGEALDRNKVMLKKAGVLDVQERVDYLNRAASEFGVNFSSMSPEGIEKWCLNLSYYAGGYVMVLEEYRKELVRQRIKARDGLQTAFYVSWGLVLILVGFVFIAVWRDFKYKEALKVILKLEKRYRNIAENMNEGVVLMNLEGKPLFTNKKFSELLGFDLKTSGKLFFDIVPETERENLVRSIEEVSEKLIESFDFEIQDGEANKVLTFSGIPFQNYRGTKVGIMGVVTNTTDLILAQREIAELSFILSQSQNAVAVIGNDGKVEWISDGFTDLYGYTWDDVVNQEIVDLKAKPQPHLMSLDELVSNDQHLSYEVINKTKDGREIWVLAQWTTLKDADGAIKKHIVIDTDITDLKKAQEVLKEEKEKAVNAVVVKDRFLANMSHELRTPLNVIIGMSGMLDAKLAEEDEDKDAIEAIHVSAKNLLAVINEVLDFSKLQAGKIELDSVPVDLNHLVKSVSRSFNYLASEKGLYLMVEGDDFPIVKTDPARLNKVFLNLVGNAIKFTNEGGITIAKKLVSKLNGRIHLEISVKDTGIGIPESKLDKVFESFAQAELDTNRRFGGTGLGLSIVKDLLDVFGGEVKLESKEGEGSCFTVVLDFEIAEDESPVLLSPSLEGMESLDDYRILVVEDQEMNRKFMAKLLEKWGAKPVFATNGEEALTAYFNTGQEFDVILMDLHMPVMDGVEATKALRSRKVTIPIYALTADYEGGKRNLSAGFNGVIIKPIRPQDLYDVIYASKKEGIVVIPSKPPEEKVTEEMNIDIKMEQFSLKNIKELSFGDDSLEVALVEDFLVSGPKNLKDLELAKLNTDFEEVRQVAHKFKQTVFYAGLDGLSEMLGKVEKIAKAKDAGLWDVLSDEMEGIQKTLHNAVEEGESFLKSKA